MEMELMGEADIYNKEWRYGVPARNNLGGTARTLDFTNGRTELQPGVLSTVSRHVSLASTNLADMRQRGFAVIDDSKSMMFTQDGWVGSRIPGREDGYLFAFGFDYRAALKAFYDVSGYSPILPRWALGNWWSRFCKS